MANFSSFNEWNLQAKELGANCQLSSFNEWNLPAKEFDETWDSLIYESVLKQRLLRYAVSAYLFIEKGIKPFLISWNWRALLSSNLEGTIGVALARLLGAMRAQGRPLSETVNQRLLSLELDGSHHK